MEKEALMDGKRKKTSDASKRKHGQTFHKHDKKRPSFKADIIREY